MDGRWLKNALTTSVVALGVIAASPACSQGEGNGSVKGTLNIPDCWTGPFDLDPDFFAAVAYRETSLIIRIQSGSDFQNFSDGISILARDITTIRPNGAESPGRYKEPLQVDIPPEVTPPGTPVVAEPDPALVSLALYLQRSCKTQTVTLNAVDQVAIPTDGTCTAEALAGADPSTGCAGTAPAGVGAGKSLIAFSSLANGRGEEEDAAQRLNQGCFDIYLANPRDAKPGELPPCRGHLRGTFSFYFERGRPAQPFP